MKYKVGVCQFKPELLNYEKNLDILEDVAKIDKAASMEGRRMSIILSPR